MEGQGKARNELLFPVKANQLSERRGQKPKSPSSGSESAGPAEAEHHKDEVICDDRGLL